ncbi:MAG: type I secretion system permease/ATPase [Phyllobacterium sp.]|uniref:type I secretion system permease/ATPase n=1 Tax=Phyllobacterium sp. TaxID=1871046 RepID=UPI0030F282B2
MAGLQRGGGGLLSFFRHQKTTLVSLALFSATINVLALTGSIFMLQIYDRVLGSRSIPTLVALTGIVCCLYAMNGALDVVRSRLLVRLGARFDEMYAKTVHRATLTIPLRMGQEGEAISPVRELDTLRSFFSGTAIVAIMDAPFMPIFLAFLFVLHPWLGWLTIAGALVLSILALLTEIFSRRPLTSTLGAALKRDMLTANGRRNAEVLKAMGFADRITERWLNISRAFISSSRSVSDVTGGLGGLSKSFRGLLQSLILAMAAWLVIRGELSAGSIIAGSIAAGRALAPIELAIANWKSFMAARKSRKKLAKVLDALPSPAEPMKLAAPCQFLIVDGLFAAPPGTSKPTIQNITMSLTAGDAVGVIGPSAAGKSTLARAVVGAWPTLKGSVRLDGAKLDQWDDRELGRHIGYLPQGIELIDGTVAENISRFDEGACPLAIAAAAKAADVHDMILRLPQGYETRLGEHGTALSAGQRQRIGLARALYREPFLVVLDEPNSNLDAEGDAALGAAIRGVRDRGGVVLLIAHRPSALGAVDLVAVMSNGMLKDFGPRETVLRANVSRASANLTLISDPTS